MESDNLSELPVVKKTPKKGIIFLSSIPPYINVSKTHEIFTQYGKVCRVFLQLDNKDSDLKHKKTKRKAPNQFTEGWVEFERKSVAKKVALLLNNTRVDNRKKSKQYDCMWNIKYLPKFKWTHLNERLAYERAVRKQKLRTEVQLAKKKTNYFTNNLHNKKKRNEEDMDKPIAKKVEETKDEEEVGENRKEFLKSLFD